MLPLEIVDRVFKIRVADGTASAFSLDIEGRQYLVTAGHVAENIKAQSTIEMFHNNNWKAVPVKLVGHSDVDVSVLCTSVLLTHRDMKLGTAIGGFFIGQDVYFAGFPLDVLPVNVESPFLAPLIKKAIISGAAGAGPKHPFYLDGNNNPGFSGGPVYLKIPSQKEYVVSMVISGYTAIHDPVYDEDGRITKQYVQQNSGIIHAYSIQNALDLIHANPIGFQLQ